MKNDSNAYEAQCAQFGMELAGMLDDLDGMYKRIGESQTRIIIDVMLQTQIALSNLAIAAATLEASKKPTPAYRSTNEQRYGAN